MDHFVVSMEIVVGQFFGKVVYYLELFGVGVVVDNLWISNQHYSMSRVGGVPLFPVFPLACR